MALLTLNDNRWHYFTYSDGSVTTVFADPATGLSKSALHELTVYSGTSGCVELLLAAAPIFVADEAEPHLLQDLSGSSISGIYFAGTEVCVLGKENVRLTEDGEAAAYQIVRN